MKLSYWEYKTWLANTDFTVVGSGIVGLSCALFIRETHPDAKILVLEKGTFPQGASTKNAGFACFGSLSEILADLDTHSEDEVLALVENRYRGIGLLRQLVPDGEMDFENLGGHEIFPEGEGSLFGRCQDQLHRINTLLSGVFPQPPFYLNPEDYGFKGVNPTLISHRFESQLNTGKMMQALLQKARNAGITVLNGVPVEDFDAGNEQITVVTREFSFTTRRLAIATNGFAPKLVDVALQPARAQVIITEPIPDLKIKGSFHLEAGYYYFRNIHNRVLLGGGRNLDFEGETTEEFGQSQLIQDRLDQLLREVIVPGYQGGIEHRWSGIMGIGKSKTPIVKEVQPGIVCGVRLGGMGVAIGTLVGKDMANLFSNP